MDRSFVALRLLKVANNWDICLGSALSSCKLTNRDDRLVKSLFNPRERKHSWRAAFSLVFLALDERILLIDFYVMDGLGTER